MFNRYFKQELDRLNVLGREFANAHPALAPLLAGPTADPDVERLLEGMAFLTGQVRAKLDDEFPEILHGLLKLVFPHYLRPIPSSTIIAFTPKGSLGESTLVPAGTSVASVPIEGIQCPFKTCFPVMSEFSSNATPPKISAASLETCSTSRFLVCCRSL